MPTEDEIAQWRVTLSSQGVELSMWETAIVLLLHRRLGLLHEAVGLAEPTEDELFDELRSLGDQPVTQEAKGTINIKVADATSVTISDTTSYHEITAPAWSLNSAGSIDFDESDGNGRLTYTGSSDVTVKVTAVTYALAAAAAQTTHWRVGVNGTTEADSEVSQEIGTSLEQITTITHTVTLSTGDHVSLFVRNATATENITVGPASVGAV